MGSFDASNPFYLFVVQLAYLALALLMLVVGKYTLNLLTPFKVDDEMSASDNPAFGVSLIGYYLGILIIFVGASYGEILGQVALHIEMAVDAAWAGLGILLLNGARLFTDKVVLHRFSTRKEIIEDRNVGMGAVEFGVYVASGLVLAGAISGKGGGLDTALAFFALGQLALVATAWVYQKLTPYDFHLEIEKDNVAAGVAYAGVIVAVGVVLMRGTAGDFTSWTDNLLAFSQSFMFALLVIVVSRYFIDLLLLPGRRLHEEIVDDRNLNAGYLDGGICVGLAAVVTFAL